MTRRIAIIPARGGSKRIPNKNIREFCGKPMIGHILNAARESSLFDTIHVSTDSTAIKDTVEAAGFPVEFLRQPELADDHTPIMPVLKYVVDTLKTTGRVFDQVWLLMACAPLVRSGDLVRAASIFESAGGVDPLIAVAEYPAPIEWAFCRAENGRLTPVQEGMFAVRSQDLEKKYFDAGSFAAFPARRVYESQGAGSDIGFVGFVLPKDRAIDVDDESDWKMAEAMFNLARG